MQLVRLEKSSHRQQCGILLLNSFILLTVTEEEISWKYITSDRQKVFRSLASVIPAPTAVTTQGCDYDTHHG